MTDRVCSLYNNGLDLCVTLILLPIIIIYCSLGSVLRALLTLEQGSTFEENLIQKSTKKKI